MGRIRAMLRAIKPTGRGGMSSSGEPLRLSLFMHAVLMVVFGVGVASLTGWALWLILGEPKFAPSHPGPLTPTDIYDGIKIALTVVGGIGGVIALVVAYRRQRYGEREHARAEAAAAREDTKLYTERFRTAADQLGSDKPAVRLAGVYAMGSLADDWPAGRQTCIDVLCAYLRMPYAVPKTKPDRPPKREERQVRQTIVKLIGEHLRITATVSWQGRDFDFSDVNFFDGDFTNVVFAGGKVRFKGARFLGRGLDFSGAQFIGGDVDFFNARFEATVEFDGAQFAGANVIFIEVLLNDALIDFDRARFENGRVDFRGAHIYDGFVSFKGAEFSGGVVDFTGATVGGGGYVNFSDTRVNGGEIHFGTSTTFSTGAVEFNGMDLTAGDIVFDKAEFSGCDVWFRGAKLSGGTLSFSGARFNAGAVHFDDAQLVGSEVNFRDAEFAGGVVDLSRLRDNDVPAHFDWATRPDGLRLPGDPLAPLTDSERRLSLPKTRAPSQEDEQDVNTAN